MGGSGAVNGGYFCRALLADFADPALPGWSWADIVGHYRAIETDLDFPERRDGGPIRIRRAAEFVGSTAIFVEAARAAVSGGCRTSTPNRWGEHPAGVGAVPSNIVDGVRSGPGAAFLEPVMNRPNLTVHTATRTVRVRLTGTRAVGITAIGPAGTIELSADRIVLSAGAIESAHLLMLSGIGPADDLRAVGVAPVADLPVGRRTSDHPELVMPTTWTVAPADRCWRCSWWTTVSEIRPYTGGSSPWSATGRRDGRTGRTSVWPSCGLGPRAGVAGVCGSRRRTPDRTPLRQRTRRRGRPAPGCELAAEIVGAQPRSVSRCGRPPSTYAVPARWAPTADEHAVLDPRAACAVSTGSGWRTVRSCRGSPAGARTPRSR